MNNFFSHFLTAVLVLMLAVPVAFAQKKGGDDYNLRKAYEIGRASCRERV